MEEPQSIAIFSQQNTYLNRLHRVLTKQNVIVKRRSELGLAIRLVEKMQPHVVFCDASLEDEIRFIKMFRTLKIKPANVIAVSSNAEDALRLRQTGTRAIIPQECCESDNDFVILTVEQSLAMVQQRRWLEGQLDSIGDTIKQLQRESELVDARLHKIHDEFSSIEERFLNKQYGQLKVIDLSLLTSRELQVYHRVAEGAFNTDIAKEFRRTVRTIERDIRNINEKLGFQNREELIMHARTNLTREERCHIDHEPESEELPYGSSQSFDLSMLNEREISIFNMVMEGVYNVDIAKRLDLNVRTIERDLKSINKKLGCKNRRELIAKAKEQMMQQLKERELQIYHMVIDGKSNREIAETFGVTIGTVKRDLRNINKKLGFEKRGELLEFAKKTNARQRRRRAAGSFNQA